MCCTLKSLQANSFSSSFLLGCFCSAADKGSNAERLSLTIDVGATINFAHVFKECFNVKTSTQKQIFESSIVSKSHDSGDSRLLSWWISYIFYCCKSNKTHSEQHTTHTPFSERPLAVHRFQNELGKRSFWSKCLRNKAFNSKEVVIFFCLC